MLADRGKASPAAGLRCDRGIFVTELVLFPFKKSKGQYITGAVHYDNDSAYKEDLDSEPNSPGH